MKPEKPFPEPWEHKVSWLDYVPDWRTVSSIICMLTCLWVYYQHRQTDTSPPAKEPVVDVLDDAATEAILESDVTYKPRTIHHVPSVGFFSQTQDPLLLSQQQQIKVQEQLLQDRLRQRSTFLRPQTFNNRAVQVRQISPLNQRVIVNRHRALFQ